MSLVILYQTQFNMARIIKLAIIGNSEYNDFDQFTNQVTDVLQKLKNTTEDVLIEYHYVSIGSKLGELSKRFLNANPKQLYSSHTIQYKNLNAKPCTVRIDKNGDSYNSLAPLATLINLMNVADYVIAFWNGTEKDSFIKRALTKFKSKYSKNSEYRQRLRIVKFESAWMQAKGDYVKDIDQNKDSLFSKDSKESYVTIKTKLNTINQSGLTHDEINKKFNDVVKNLTITTESHLHGPNFKMLHGNGSLEGKHTIRISGTLRKTMNIENLNDNNIATVAFYLPVNEFADLLKFIIWCHENIKIMDVSETTELHNNDAINPQWSYMNHKGESVHFCYYEQKLPEVSFQMIKMYSIVNNVSYEQFVNLSQWGLFNAKGSIVFKARKYLECLHDLKLIQKD
ncbi:gp183 [Sphingomonas phage PAU]|uniref:gp183 n=1 Tax=Sphingomonas phage PAU TaxID=1150991 RepID=UPI0002573303|nr:gp183 [Sphingomonas phage PAU]AFF28181.1 gp183 [Sphingomonas phage PAU]